MHSLHSSSQTGSSNAVTGMCLDAFEQDDATPTSASADVVQLAAAVEAIGAHQQLQSQLLLDVAGAIQQLGEGVASVRRGINQGELLARLERLEGTLHWSARAATRPGAPIRVLFLIHHATAWPALREVVDEMRAAADFEPVILSLPHHFPLLDRLAGEDEVHAMLQAQGYPHIRLRDDEASQALDYVKSLAPAVIFRQAPWDADLPPSLSARQLSFAKLCYVPYGYLTAKIEKQQFDQLYHRQCWRIFCPDDAHRALFEHHNLLGDLNCRVTGYPKFDHLARQHGQPGRWPVEGGVEGAYRLLWAPHFSSTTTQWLRFGVFDRICDDMLALAEGDPSLEITLRPHPALREAMLAATHDSPLGRFLQRWGELPNTAFSDEADYADLFAASHAMLTDGLSFFSEYQLFDKPLVFFERGDHIGFNAAGARLLDGMYRVGDVAGWLDRLRQCRAGIEDATVVAARRRIAAELRPHPGAAAREIVDVIRREIGHS